MMEMEAESVLFYGQFVFHNIGNVMIESVDRRDGMSYFHFATRTIQMSWVSYVVIRGSVEGIYHHHHKPLSIFDSDHRMRVMETIGLPFKSIINLITNTIIPECGRQNPKM